MTFRSLLLASAVTLSAAPAFAADLGYAPPAGDPVYTAAPLGLAGHLELALGVASADDLFEDDDSVGIFQGYGRANIPMMGGAWNVLLETGAVALFDDGYSTTTSGVYGHLWTNFSGLRVGAFGGAAFGGPTVGTVGAEVEGDVGALTLGGQASYSWTSDDFDADIWGLRGWADFYFTPNTKLGADIAYANIDAGMGDGDVWALSGMAEHRFAGTPISAFGRLSYVDLDEAGDAWVGLLGARVFLDNPGSTLQDHDKAVPFDYRGIAGIGTLGGY
jgi:hypothetical protein